MVWFKRQKRYAKGILLLYGFITVTFPFAHHDFVALDVKLSLSPIDFHSNALDSNTNDLVSRLTTSRNRRQGDCSPHTGFFSYSMWPRGSGAA